MVKFRPLNVKSVRDKGTYVFGDFSIGLYYLDTPRLLGEQLGSLALIGGQNIWSEKGALVPQYGYKILGSLPEEERAVAVTKDSSSSASFFIVTVDGENNSHIYLYTANQGLKKYKSNLGSVTNPIVSHDGKNLIIHNEGATYLFGSYYSTATAEVLDTNCEIYDYYPRYEIRVPETSIDYYWNGKELTLNQDNKEFHATVLSMSEGEGYASVFVNVEPIIENNVEIYPTSGTCDTAENTVKEIDLIYYPEDYDETIPDTDPDYVPPVTINPLLIEVAQNRLFVVDITGRIYYSAIGGVDLLAGDALAFDQNSDAGFFEGFYKDSSKVLSIEDYMDGVLICKENGIYYLTLAAQSFQLQNTTASGGNAILSIGDMQVSIKKIANIGQQYAGDHVIVRETVIAYDSNSGTIVNAASLNVFNNIVAGDVIIDSAALNAYNSGITNTKRKLTYNGQENLFTLYYGEDLTNGVVLKLNATLFPRKLDIPMETFIGFNQGVVGVGENGEIIQDFKNGTIIENIPAYADFEAIGVRDNRAIVSTLLEVTELNGVDYTITTKNTGTSVQSIHPNLNVGVGELRLPPLMYSDKDYKIISDSFELTSRWADKKAHVTRIASPMSGRDGINISIEFPKNTTFCLAALRLPDFSLGEI